MFGKYVPKVSPKAVGARFQTKFFAAKLCSFTARWNYWNFIPLQKFSTIPHNSLRVIPPIPAVSLPARGYGQKKRETIHEMAESGDLEAVKLSLKEKASEFKENENDVVKDILSANRNENGWTILHSACSSSNTELVTELLDRGADLESITKNGNSPLAVAAMNGRVDIVNLLLSRGANLFLKDFEGLTPFHWAALKGQTEVLRALLHNMDPKKLLSLQDENGMTALHWAASEGMEDAANLLVHYGADVEARDVDGWTPLHHAARQGRIELVHTLLRWGANKDALGNTKEGKKRPIDITKSKQIKQLLSEFSAEQALSSYYGLKPFKQFVADLSDWTFVDDYRQKQGFPKLNKSVHCLFIGNPGTGKSLAATILSRHMQKLHLLSKGHVAYVMTMDAVTAQKLNDSLGGVLYINVDTSDLFTSKNVNNAIHLLTQHVYDHPNDNAVILGGYSTAIQVLLKQYPSLRVVFSHRVDFPDYTMDELHNIALQEISQQGFELDKQGTEKLNEMLESVMLRNDARTGNSRVVHQLIIHAIFNQSRRIAASKSFSKIDLKTLTLQDFEKAMPPEPKNLPQSLRWKALTSDNMLELVDTELLGGGHVKKFIRNLVSMVEMNEIRAKQGLPKIEMQHHMIFKGNPGTGKSTVGIFLAILLKKLNILSLGQFIEVKSADLISASESLRETGQQTLEIITSAMGGVLYIDQAHLLTNNQYRHGNEALRILLQMMEDHSNDFVVIFSANAPQVDDMLASNAELRARFPNILHFEDLTTPELKQVAIKILEEQHFKLTPKAEKKLNELIDLIVIRRKFPGNARDIRNMTSQLIGQHSTRVFQNHLTDPKMILELTEEDVAGLHFVQQE